MALYFTERSHRPLSVFIRTSFGHESFGTESFGFGGSLTADEFKRET